MYVNRAECFLLILAALKESRAVALLDLLQLAELNPNALCDLHGTTRLITIANREYSVCVCRAYSAKGCTCIISFKLKAAF